MRRSILAVCIVVAVIVLVTIPAAADITPPKKIASPLFQEVWNALMNLQGQINAIEDQIAQEIWPGVMQAAGNDIAQNLQLANLKGLRVVRCSEATGENWQKGNPGGIPCYSGYHSCTLYCPGGMEVVDASYDGNLREQDPRGYAGLEKCYPDDDQIDHVGTVLCL